MQQALSANRSTLGGRDRRPTSLYHRSLALSATLLAGPECGLL